MVMRSKNVSGKKVGGRMKLYELSVLEISTIAVVAGIVTAIMIYSLLLTYNFIFGT